MATRGLALGSFDMFHVGHLRALRRAAHLCEHLTVAVADDALVAERFGAAPLVPLDHRLEVLGGFAIAADVVTVDTDAAVALMDAYTVDVAFVAGDRDAIAAHESVDVPFALRVIDVESTVSESLQRVADRALLWVPSGAFEPVECR